MKFEDLTPREARILHLYYGDHDHLDLQIEETTPEQLKRIVAMYDSPCTCPSKARSGICQRCRSFKNCFDF